MPQPRLTVQASSLVGPTDHHSHHHHHPRHHHHPHQQPTSTPPQLLFFDEPFFSFSLPDPINSTNNSNQNRLNNNSSNSNNHFQYYTNPTPTPPTVSAHSTTHNNQNPSGLRTSTATADDDHLQLRPATAAGPFAFSVPPLNQHQHHVPNSNNSSNRLQSNSTLDERPLTSQTAGTTATSVDLLTPYTNNSSDEIPSTTTATKRNEVVAHQHLQPQRSPSLVLPHPIINTPGHHETSNLRPNGRLSYPTTTATNHSLLSSQIDVLRSLPQHQHQNGNHNHQHNGQQPSYSVSPLNTRPMTAPGAAWAAASLDHAYDYSSASSGLFGQSLQPPHHTTPNHHSISSDPASITSQQDPPQSSSPAATTVPRQHYPSNKKNDGSPTSIIRSTLPPPLSQSTPAAPMATANKTAHSFAGPNAILPSSSLPSSNSNGLAISLSHSSAAPNQEPRPDPISQCSSSPPAINNTLQMTTSPEHSSSSILLSHHSHSSPDSLVIQPPQSSNSNPYLHHHQPTAPIIHPNHLINRPNTHAGTTIPFGSNHHHNHNQIGLDPPDGRFSLQRPATGYHPSSIPPPPSLSTGPLPSSSLLSHHHVPGYPLADTQHSRSVIFSGHLPALPHPHHQPHHHHPYLNPHSTSTLGQYSHGPTAGIFEGPGLGGNSERLYNFNILPGAPRKRARRRFDEVERLYDCNYPGCTKAYGTLNHLNAHITMQKHGPKRLPQEFKEIRKEWRARKKAEAEARTIALKHQHMDPNRMMGQQRMGYESVRPHTAIGVNHEDHRLLNGGRNDDDDEEEDEEDQEDEQMHHSAPAHSQRFTLESMHHQQQENRNCNIGEWYEISSPSRDSPDRNDDQHQSMCYAQVQPIVNDPCSSSTGSTASPLHRHNNVQ